MNRRTNRFNKLIKILRNVAYCDRDRIIWWANIVKGFSLEEIANVFTPPMTRENVRRIVEGQKLRNEGKCPECGTFLIIQKETTECPGCGYTEA